jgi:hypothetical protein
MKKIIFSFLLSTFFICNANAGIIEADTVVKKNMSIGKDCEKIEAIYVIISQAIETGAPTYNAGNHLGCYMIYEGAAYKILHKYGTRCVDVSNVLEGALEKSYGNYSSTDKAWIMRMAFDQILGEETKTK